LTNIDRIIQLFALVLIAFAGAGKVEICWNYPSPNQDQKASWRAQSLFKDGLIDPANVLSLNDKDKLVCVENFVMYLNFLFISNFSDFKRK